MPSTFEQDTNVELNGTGFVANVNEAWDIWGPNGGYLASIALRAAGAATSLPQPASIAATFLRTGTSGELALDLTPLRESRRAACYRVSGKQAGEEILEALVWFVGLPPADGPLSRADARALSDPRALRPTWEHMGLKGPISGIQSRIEERQDDYCGPWSTAPAGAARWTAWYRFLPQATFEDPVVDAARSIVLCDMYPLLAAMRPHAELRSKYISPTLSLTVSFRAGVPTEFLYCDAESSWASDGSISADAHIFDESGQVIAIGSQVALPRRL